MEDEKILNLYFARDEFAIRATAQKYDAYCTAISLNILRSREDAEECVSDTYLRAWEAIPPKRPSAFRVYLGKITRNLSLDLYRRRTSKKRLENETALLFSELDECIPGGLSAEAEYETTSFCKVMNDSLRSLNQVSRLVFIRRYFYGESIKKISEHLNMSEGRLKTMLFRVRKKMKADFIKEGVFI